jgi:hypothetical protein
MTTRRPVVEFPHLGAVGGLFGEFLADAACRQAIENAELALAQALVDDRLGLVAGERPRLANRLRGLAGAEIGGGQDELRTLGGGKLGEPAACGFGLAEAKVGQRHVDIADIEIDDAVPGGIRLVAGDIALALAMADQPQAFRPILAHRRSFRAKQSISGANCSTGAWGARA